MPRTVIKHPKDKMAHSLGRLAYWWISNFVVYGPGSVRGQPVRFGPERLSELLHMYALDPDSGRRLYHTVFYSKPKGSDKSGMAGYLTCFEAVGPARFAGWAAGGETYNFLGRTYIYKPGEPMGRPVVEPFIRCLATEEDQTGNIYDVVLHNFQEGPLADLNVAAFDAYIETTDHGFVYASTAGAASKDGGKETFVPADETHLWTTPRLRSLYTTIKRNLSKRPLEEPWLLETTTMYNPGAMSIAEETYTLAEAIREGRVKKPNLLFLHQYGSIKLDDVGDEALLRAALMEAQGEAAAWLSVDDIIANHFYDPREDVRDSIRYYLNALSAAASAWIDHALLEKVTSAETLQPGDEIALGFDGSLTGDSTALVATRLRDNLVQLLHIQEAPVDPKEATLWTVDQNAADRAVFEAFSTYKVKAFFADPPYWKDPIERWEMEFGATLAPSTREHPIMWWTNREFAMANAVERATTLFKTMGLKVSADPTLKRHINNTRVWPRRSGNLIGKELKNSPKKMDASMAMVLSLEAAAIARTYTPKSVVKKDENHGLITEIPLSMLTNSSVRSR